MKSKKISGFNVFMVVIRAIVALVCAAYGFMWAEWAYSVVQWDAEYPEAAALGIAPSNSGAITYIVYAGIFFILAILAWVLPSERVIGKLRSKLGVSVSK